MSGAETRFSAFLGRLPWIAYVGIAAVLFAAVHLSAILAAI